MHMFNKKSVYCLVFFVGLIQGCVSDEIIDAKPGEALPPVENLTYRVEGTAVEINWVLPQAIPADIILPLSVQVRVTVDGQIAGTFVLQEAPESYVYQGYDPSKSYRVTVKAIGNVNTSEAHRSNIRYSLGRTTSF